MKTKLPFQVITGLLLTLVLLSCQQFANAQLVLPSIAGATQNQPAAVEKDAVVFGTRIHYLEAGSGPAVILLHGLGGSSQNWALNIAPLAQKFRVIVPDQIGFGKSDKPLIHYRVGTYVDFLDQFCKELKIERASLV